RAPEVGVRGVGGGGLLWDTVRVAWEWGRGRGAGNPWGGGGGRGGDLSPARADKGLSHLGGLAGAGPRVGERGLGPPRQLLGRHVLDVGGEGPDVAERVGHLAVAVAPEHVRWRHALPGAPRPGPLEPPVA